MRQQATLSVIIKRPPPSPEPFDVFVSWFTPISSLIATLVAIASCIAAGVYGIIKYRRREMHKEESADASD